MYVYNVKTLVFNFVEDTIQNFNQFQQTLQQCSKSKNFACHTIHITSYGYCKETI